MSHVSLRAKYSLGGNRAWLLLEIALWEAHGDGPVIHYTLTIWDRLMCQFSTTTFTTSTTHPCKQLDPRSKASGMARLR